MKVWPVLIIISISLAVTATQAVGGYLGLSYDLSTGGGLHEEDSRFLPGLYYFDKGCEYSKRGDTSAAIEIWMISAGWAMKRAQYNLGITYFRGIGVSADRPRGLAWLALAAERKEPQFIESLAAAWDEATPAERELANAIWRDLRREFGDAVALRRAQIRFESEINQITGSRVGMPGHVMISTAAGMMDGASYRARLASLAVHNLGTLPTGSVEIEPIQPLDGASVEAKH
jgi:hypothetical protein